MSCRETRDPQSKAHAKYQLSGSLYMGPFTISQSFTSSTLAMCSYMHRRDQIELKSRGPRPGVSICSRTRTPTSIFCRSTSTHYPLHSSTGNYVLSLQQFASFRSSKLPLVLFFGNNLHWLLHLYLRIAKIRPLSKKLGSSKVFLCDLQSRSRFPIVHEYDSDVILGLGLLYLLFTIRHR
jgi:hypothetical protein